MLNEKWHSRQINHSQKVISLIQKIVHSSFSEMSCHAAFSTIFHFIMIGRPNFQIAKVYPPANVNVRSAVSVSSISHWTTDPNFKIDSIYFCFWHILSSNRQQIRFIHSIAFRDHILSSIHPINLNYSFKYW